MEALLKVVLQMLVVALPPKVRRRFTSARQQTEEPANTADSKAKEEADKIQKQVATTYSNLRYGLAVISALFPLWLKYIGQWWYGIPPQGSMSAYYWAVSTSDGPWRSAVRSLNLSLLTDLGLTGLGNNPPMRTWFVGILFLLGFFLYLYKGFTLWENIFLNAAGVGALGVALFPMTWSCVFDSTCPDYGKLHGGFALITFVSIGVVALVFAKNTLDWIPLGDGAKTAAYRWWYRIIGWLFIGLVVAAFATMPGDNWPDRIYYLELVGVILFAAYWWVKSNELSEDRGVPAKQFETLAVQQNSELVKGLKLQQSPGTSTQGKAAAG